MKHKTHKTVAKRIRVTRTGKVIKRKGGQDHFNSHESGKVTRNKRRNLKLFPPFAKNAKSLM